MIGSLATLTLLAGVGTAGAQPKPVALVNGDSIFLDEVDAEVKKIAPSIAPLPPSQQKQLRLQVLSGLIDDMLLRQFFKKNGPQIEQAEIDKQFATLEASMKAQGKTLNEFYRESQQSEAQVRANMVIMLQMVRFTKERATDAELQKFFELNREHFEKVTVRASHIVFRLAAGTSASERLQSKDKLAQIRAEIVGGKIEFAEAAKKFSQCPSAPKGGDVGFFARKGVLDDNFAKAAFALKIGDVSEVTESEFGYHLIKATERNAGKPVKYEEVIEDVREAFMEDLRMGIIATQRKGASISVSLP